jgi:2'-5' RNA ligase
MPSIVTAIDDPYREWIEEAAGEIKAITGRKDLPAATRPHVTLHVADRYAPGIDDAIAGVVASTPLLEFKTGEVGVFRGPQVVVALQVLRTESLLRLHSRLSQSVARYAESPKHAYATETWAPHITIIAGSIEDQHIEDVIAVLARRNFAWTVPLTNLCLVPGPRARDWTRFELQVGNRPTD